MIQRTKVFFALYLLIGCVCLFFASRFFFSKHLPLIQKWLRGSSTTAPTQIISSSSQHCPIEGAVVNSEDQSAFLKQVKNPSILYNLFIPNRKNQVLPHQIKNKKITELRRQILNNEKKVNELSKHIPMKIVIIDTQEDHANVRRLVGTIHKFYTPPSIYDRKVINPQDAGQPSQDIRIIIYGMNLNSINEREILLWKNIDYVNLFDELFKLRQVLQDGQEKPVIEDPALLKKDYWRNYVIRHAVERHDKVLYIDNDYILTKRLDHVNDFLNEYGSYFVSTEGASGPLLPKCSPSIQGYVIDSYAYYNYLLPSINCGSQKVCSDKETEILRHDGSSISKFSQVAADEDRVMTGMKCQTIDGLTPGNPGDQESLCYIHTREDILFLPSQVRRNVAIEDHKIVRTHSEYETHIGIGAPTTSKNQAGPLPDSLTFFTTNLPSLLNTIPTKEDKRYYFRVYLAFDEGDGFYDNAENQRRVIEKFASMTSNYAMELHLIRVVQTYGWTTFLWNVAFQNAMDDGCDYFYQVNDDLQFREGGWLDDFTSRLRDNTVLSNLGAVGPLDERNGNIFTQAFVHRTHYKIFGFFYPPIFKNWYSDDFITHVYDKFKSSFRSPKRVYNSNSAGTRYSVCSQQGHARLQPSIAIGEKWIGDYINEKKNK